MSEDSKNIELDPELVQLSRPYAGPGPVLSLSIVVFCAYIFINLWPDFRYWQQGQPTNFDARTFGTAAVTAEDYVGVKGLPDYSLAVRVRTSRASDGYRLTRVLGTNGRLWLLVDGDALRPPAPSGQTEHTTGRLRRISDTRYASQLRTYVNKLEKQPHVVTATALKAALTSGAKQVQAPSGDQIPVQPTTHLSVAETLTGKALIRVSTDQFLDRDWSKILVEAGILEPGGTHSHAGQFFVSYVVNAPNGLRDIDQRLFDAQLGLEAEPWSRQYETTWADLAAGVSDLKIGQTTQIQWSDITNVTIRSEVRVPSDALVLIADEHPQRYWYVLPIYILLAVFAGLFVWAFVRSVRHDPNA